MLDAAEDSFVPPVVGAGNPGAAGDPWRRAGRAGAGGAARSMRPTRPRRSITTRWSRTPSWRPVGRRHGCQIDTPSQGMAMAQAADRRAVRPADPADIHIRSPFLGGGFGSKGMISGPQVLGIMAARLVGRPVKLVLAAGADVRPGRASRADPADGCSMGADAAGRVDRDRATTPRRASSTLRRLLRARLRHLAHALCQPGDQPPRTRRCGIDTGHAAVHAGARRGDRQHAALESAIDEMAAGVRHGPRSPSA